MTQQSDQLRIYARNGVARDWVDLRDNIYKPSLSTLGSSMLPAQMLFHEHHAGGQSGKTHLTFGIRQQGNAGRCVGFALAALIDVQRRLQGASIEPLTTHDCASAEMLYHMARFHDQYTLLNCEKQQDHTQDETAVSLESRQNGVRSLRSVVKGFYHHGVFCDNPERPELTWGSERSIPNVSQAKAARSVGLGAYYRLLPVLNDYHAALNDTGTILVSASIHEGWLTHKVRDAGGVIEWAGEVGEGTQHAVVIIGYTAEGFLVLNSWGSQWGGIEGYAGIALWSYSDWARNVIDGWVLRLGVSAPTAFDVSIGEQGLAHAYGTIRKGSTPCLELMGHYIHVDDGYYTELSAYPSNPQMMEETLLLLPDALQRGVSGKSVNIGDTEPDRLYPRKGLLLWISGSLEGMKASFETAVRRKRIANSLDLYPFFVFWSNDFVEDSIVYLRDKFTGTKSISGSDAAHRDRLIENSVRGTGRAFWREVESCARRGIWDTLDPEQHDLLRGTQRGHLGKFLTELYNLVEQINCEIHIVVDGAGALVFEEMLRMFERLDEMKRSELASRITTVNLSLPAIDMERANHRILPLIHLLNYQSKKNMPHQPDGTGPHDWISPARIHVPSKELEGRVCNGDYGKSILHLIANAFEDRRDQRNGGGTHLGGPGGQPKTMLGMAEARFEWEASNLTSGLTNPFCVLDQLHSGSSSLGKIDQIYLTRDPGLDAEIMKTIQYHATKFRQTTTRSDIEQRAVTWQQESNWIH